MTTEQMKETCDTVTDYLQSAKAYKNSDLTLSTIAHETGICHKKISMAINTYLNKTFFELVNTMRVEEAKRQLQNLNTEHTIESIAAECGFRSRTTFFVTFKKNEGMSPALLQPKLIKNRKFGLCNRSPNVKKNKMDTVKSWIEEMQSSGKSCFTFSEVLLFVPLGTKYW
jgi:AraC-like DNA-binding protein